MKELFINALPIILLLVVFIGLFLYSKKKAFKLLLDMAEWAEKNILGSKQGQARKKKVIDNFYASPIVPWYLKALPRPIVEGWLEKAVSLLKTSLRYAYEHSEDHKPEDKAETSASDEEEG